MIRKFSDETFDEISDYEIYKLIDKPNVDFLMPDGFAGKIKRKGIFHSLYGISLYLLRTHLPLLPDLVADALQCIINRFGRFIQIIGNLPVIHALQIQVAHLLFQRT